ncbi:hypothetical protein M438DRAFT_358858 [Aureobasidium pullulans EXF-150]|uniref:Uncharacterized protein n=1 Tax=Aureobasidium pullulans EXF-150 TaxID=1043002 RepID=A0A074X4U0_AURPU|nr:uncharacterized protein M438DRAFT_358858 [Aureobasidium pullulans EXF-150]KEQ80408.1 hypothetical protein M438DRAFT_358858 [Aureobasidium pullulans EXF-150]
MCNNTHVHTLPYNQCVRVRETIDVWLRRQLKHGDEVERLIQELRSTQSIAMLSPSTKPDRSATEELMESTDVLADYFPTASTSSPRFLPLSEHQRAVEAVHLPARGDDQEFFSRQGGQSLEIARLPALFHGCGFQVACVATSWMCSSEDWVEVFLLGSQLFGLGVLGVMTNLGVFVGLGVLGVLADMDASASLRDSGWQGR